MKGKNGSLKLYEIRDRLLRSVRSYFYKRRFIELDPSLMVASPGIEPHLEAFEIFYKGILQSYLPTSPEFYIKKIIAKGFSRVFAISHSFRAEEYGRFHSPEFLMLEWYRAKSDYREIMKDCERLLTHMVISARQSGFFPSHLEIPFIKLSLEEAFIKYTGLAWIKLKSLNDWQRHCINNGAPVNAKKWSLTDCYSYLMVSRIEQNLPDGPVILYDFPVFQCALAKPKKNKPEIIERFELYWKKIEIANGYSELTDKKELLRRYRRFSKERVESGKKPHPLDKIFVEIHDNLPECGGIALGIDRLFSILIGSEINPASCFNHYEK